MKPAVFKERQLPRELIRTDGKKTCFVMFRPSNGGGGSPPVWHWVKESGKGTRCGLHFNWFGQSIDGNVVDRVQHVEVLPSNRCFECCSPRHEL